MAVSRSGMRVEGLLARVDKTFNFSSHPGFVVGAQPNFLDRKVIIHMFLQHAGEDSHLFVNIGIRAHTSLVMVCEPGTNAADSGVRETAGEKGYEVQGRRKVMTRLPPNHIMITGTKSRQTPGALIPFLQVSED